MLCLVAPLSESMQECLSLVRFLSSKPECEPFLEAVDWQLYGLTDYPEIIKNPMDLGTVQQKLEEGKYSTPQQFASDIRLVWENCMKYNRPDSDLHQTAEKMSKLFEKKYQKIKSGGGGGSSGGGGGGSAKKKEGGEKNNNNSEREVSRADRLKFSQFVNQLTPEQLGTLVEMIQKECPEAINEEEDDEIEIEINNIDGQTLLLLNNYANNCIQGGGGGGVNDSNKKQKLK